MRRRAISLVFRTLNTALQAQRLFCFRKKDPILDIWYEAGGWNLPLTGTTVHSKEMKKGTAEGFLSILPTKAVSGLIFVSVLQSLDS